MSTLDALWSGSSLMVRSGTYKVLFSQKLSNGWYLGQLIIDCELGYALSTQILSAGDQEIWTAL